MTQPHTHTEQERLHEDNDRLKERCLHLQQSNDRLTEERNDWQRSHEFLVDNGYAWVGDLSLLLSDEMQTDESFPDCWERLLEELRTLRAASLPDPAPHP